MQEFEYPFLIEAQTEEEAENIMSFFTLIYQNLTNEELIFANEACQESPEIVEQIVKQIRNIDKIKSFMNGTLGKAVTSFFGFGKPSKKSKTP